MRLNQRPYNLFLLTAIVFFIAVLFSFNLGIDLAFHDTYFLIPLALLIWLPVIISILFWLFYLLTSRFLFSKTLTWIHIILTIVCSILILVLPFLFSYPAAVEVILMSLLILSLGQALYFVNLIFGLSKKATRKKIIKKHCHYPSMSNPR